MFCKDVKNWLIKHQPRPPEGNPLRRLITLSCLIAVMTKAERASYKALGKEMDDNTDLESRIKKAKRWLTNKWTDIETHFIPYIKPIIRSIAKTEEIVIAIDGSTMGSGCMCLMISMIWRGRSIPICWVVRKAPKGHFPQEMHIEVTKVVNELFKVLVPQDCTKSIVQAYSAIFLWDIHTKETLFSHFTPKTSGYFFLFFPLFIKRNGFFLKKSI